MKYVLMLVVLFFAFSFFLQGELIELAVKDIENRIDCDYNKSLAAAIVFSDKTEFVIRGNGVTKDSIFEIGSITKLFTAHLILILDKEGVLSINDRVSSYLPKFPAHLKDITILHLLEHSSGIYDPSSQNYFNKENGNTVVVADYSLEDALNYLDKMPLKSLPGEVFAYSNLGYGLLGVIIEKATGKSYEEVLKKKILKPLKLHSTYLIVPEKEKYRLIQGYQNGIAVPFWQIRSLVAFGALKSSVKDLSLYLKYLFFDGKIDLEIQKKLIQPLQKFVLNGIVPTLGLTIDRRYQGFFFASTGRTLGFSAFLGFSPSLKKGVVLLTDSDSMGNIAHSWLNPNFPRYKVYKPIVLQKSQLKTFEGVYKGIGEVCDLSCTILAGDGYLKIFSEGELLHRVYPKSENEFFIKYLNPTSGLIKFSFDRKGKLLMCMRTAEGKILKFRREEI